MTKQITSQDGTQVGLCTINTATPKIQYKINNKSFVEFHDYEKHNNEN